MSQSYEQIVQKLEALKKQQPHLRAKLDAQLNFYRNKINQIRSNVPQKFYGDMRSPTASTVHMGEQEMANGTQHPVSKYLSQQKQMQLNKLKELELEMNKEASLITNLQAKGQQVPTTGPMSLQSNLMSVAKKLRPGNLGDINRVVWPFWFTTSKVTLVPNSVSQANVTVTQEAAFIWLGHTKAVFLEEPGNAGNYNYIDPEQPDASAKANNLTMVIRDSQSSRVFMNKSIDVNQVGTWKYPTILPTPQLILPNSNLEFQFSNSDQNNTYRPFVTIYGLRVRIQDAQDILSTISG